MDLDRLTKLAGIEVDKSKVVTVEAIENLRKEINDYFDYLVETTDLNTNTVQLNEGLFTDLKAVFSMGSTAAKAVAKNVGGKVSAAFNDAKAKVQLGKFEKAVKTVVDDLQKFDSDTDIQAVLKTDKGFVSLLRNVHNQLESLIVRIEAFKAPPAATP